MLIGLLRRGSDVRQLLKEMKFAELPAAATSYHGCFLKVLLCMDLIKSRPLIFLSPGALETAALWSCCLYTTRSLFVANEAEETWE